MVKPTKDKYQVGTRVLVFDALAWNKTGDIGDNSCFDKLATIVTSYQKDEPLAENGICVDVVFDERPDQVSCGHFAGYSVKVLQD